MRAIPIFDYAGIPSPRRVVLERAIRSQPTLADVLEWGHAQAPPLTVAREGDRLLGFAACAVGGAHRSDDEREDVR